MERAQARAVLEMVLIDPLRTEESIEVTINLVQAPSATSNATGSTAIGATSAATSPPITLVTTQLSFNASNCNIPQEIVLVPGDDALEGGPEPFQLVFTAHSRTGEERPKLLQKKVVPGLRTDDELLPGWSFEDPVVITREAQGRISAQELGLLAAPSSTTQKNTTPSSELQNTDPNSGTNEGTFGSTNTNSRKKQGGAVVHVGDELNAQGSMPLGSATYYNLTVSQKAVVDVQACGEGVVPVVAVYADSRAAW